MKTPGARVQATSKAAKELGSELADHLAGLRKVLLPETGEVVGEFAAQLLCCLRRRLHPRTGCFHQPCLKRPTPRSLLRSRCLHRSGLCKGVAVTALSRVPRPPDKRSFSTSTT